MRQGIRGLALASTMWMVFLLLLFGMTLAGLSTSQLQLSQANARRAQALQAAEAGLVLAEHWLSRDPHYGTHGESLDDTVDGARFRLSFADDQAEPSCNNLEGVETRTGPNGRVVPPYCALLNVVGTDPSGSRTVTLEVLTRFASFPYALAGDRVVSKMSLQVAARPNLVRLQDDSKALPAHVWGGQSVACQGLTVVSGRVRSAGTVTLGAATVAGVDQGAPMETLPDLTIQDYNTRELADVTTMLSPGPYVAPSLAGPIYVDGDLDLVAPVFVGTRLYVTGNLRVMASMAGTGSVFVQGQTAILGTGTMVGQDAIAIFSQGPISVQGGVLFHGVLYSHQDIHIQTPLTVVGAVVSRSGQVTLSGPTVITYVADLTRLGTSWAQQGMLGHLLSGPAPPLERVYWRER